jgi:Cu+-exporting ATPase
VEKTALHPIANAIMEEAELLKLDIPATSGQLTEPGFGCLAEVDGCLVAVGTLDWVHNRFETKASSTELTDLGNHLEFVSSSEASSNHSKSIAYVGREGEGIIGAIAVSDVLRDDAKATVDRYLLQIPSVCIFIECLLLYHNSVKHIFLTGHIQNS